MSRRFTLAVVSDIHFACAKEQARGDDYETAAVRNPLLRLLLRFYRRFIWLHQPLRQNHLLDQFLQRVGDVHFVIANGDFSCDTGFVGVSDDSAFESAKECLTKLRSRFGENFRATIGDHEIGKRSFVGGNGGMRLASFHRAEHELQLQPFWQTEIGRYVLIGVTSSLIGLPVFEPDALPEEISEWKKLREEHLAKIRAAFSSLKTEQRVILSCHDPTALPFLWREDAVREKLPQIEHTIIGHLHTNLIFWKSKLLAGMPPIHFLGHSTRRMTKALSEAKYWKPFHVRLCPSLSGVELLKDGGFLTAELDTEAGEPAKFQLHRIRR
jgi:hypothetical protein